ncbi:hypothetical protein CLV59_102522 [Chitinophaga dinghuensis]|uniref:Lipopolysaccharide biosynthesis protein n=1 Tax=Chitinophaga dinghuensis TaxID=1539050 RepID=A0A327W5P3_9BACT|nr:capsular biosynthesis protein CpsH [Chitinophaga dinghuensis]RAJ85817.1 hypothetical protein CLV59_102522 [Chitinophaga dinghuensis]
MLEGKSILFISPSFFNYEKEILKKMQGLGANVTFYDDRPSNSVLVRGLIRLNKKILKNRIRRYYEGILQKIIATNGYDFLLLIKGETIPPEFLQQFRQRFPKCRTIMYQYDSIRNNQNAIACFPYFDRILSFDLSDTEQYPAIKFRPLFYIDDYKDLKQQSPKYDYTFIGTAHSDRYNWVMNLVKENGKDNRFFTFFYCPSKILYYGRVLFDKSFKQVKKEDISFSQLNKQQVLDIVSQSRAIVDIQHPNQTGLTMRTIEALGAGKKLVTTNRNIVKYDFYNPGNILVLDRTSSSIAPGFAQTAYTPVSTMIYQKYSLEGWLNEVMDIK